jgi:hypothetical protein
MTCNNHSSQHILISLFFEKPARFIPQCRVKDNALQNKKSLTIL